MGIRHLTLTAAAAALLVTACGGGEQRANDEQPAADTQLASENASAPGGGADGRAVFMRTCVTCHQQNGQGLANSFPPIAGSEIIAGDKARLIRLVLHGLQGPITVHGQAYNNVMPPWKTLSDADMAAVLTYVRSNFGNSASAVTAEEVAAERAATASRTTMWTAQELGL